MLRKTHLIVGILGLLAFVLQGQYMDLALAHLVGLEDGPRMLFRSSHIYLLLAALLNVVMGVYMRGDIRFLIPELQLVVSVIVLAAPFALLAGFFLESHLADFIRPYTRPALYALFGIGVILSLVGVFGWLDPAESQSNPTDAD